MLPGTNINVVFGFRARASDDVTPRHGNCIPICRRFRKRGQVRNEELQSDLTSEAGTARPVETQERLLGAYSSEARRSGLDSDTDRHGFEIHRMTAKQEANDENMRFSSMVYDGKVLHEHFLKARRLKDSSVEKLDRAGRAEGGAL